MSKQAKPIELSAKDVSENGETFCPNPAANMKLWNSHPRVYLNVSHGAAKCAYCGTVYQLRAGEKLAGGH